MFVHARVCLLVLVLVLVLVRVCVRVLVSYSLVIGSSLFAIRFDVCSLGRHKACNGLCFTKC